MNLPEITINRELQNVYVWLAANKLSLNITKTKYLVFHSQKKSLSSLPLLKINNTLIEKVSSFNYLGVMLNENLTWNTHIDKISSKVSKYNGLLNKLKHYLASNVLKTLYESLILPHINYALLDWGFNSTRIYQLQKKAIRILTKSKFNH